MQMADYQTGKEIAATDRDAIVTWLKALTGEVDADYIKQPVLPKSTSKTPRPRSEA
jgi:hypothetical protein